MAISQKPLELWRNQNDPLNFNKINTHSLDDNFTKISLNFGETNLHSTNIKFTKNLCIGDGLNQIKLCHYKSIDAP